MVAVLFAVTIARGLVVFCIDWTTELSCHGESECGLLTLLLLIFLSGVSQGCKSECMAFTPLR